MKIYKIIGWIFFAIGLVAAITEPHNEAIPFLSVAMYCWLSQETYDLRQQVSKLEQSATSSSGSSESTLS